MHDQREKNKNNAHREVMLQVNLQEKHNLLHLGGVWFGGEEEEKS